MENCPICGATFTPAEGQKPAQWAMSWCEGASGLLCPPCHVVADGLHAVSDEPLPLGIVPWKSDIAKASPAVAKERYAELRRDESWRVWVERNHPEWI